MRRLSADLWIAEGVSKFGTARLKWKFRCPSCGNIQSALDFIPLSKKGHPVNAVLVTCRRSIKDSSLVLPDSVQCNFNSYDFKNEELILVDNGNGKEIPTFPFADS